MTSSWEYLKGKDNMIADALSQVTQLAEVETKPDLDTIPVTPDHKYFECINFYTGKG